MKPIRVQLHYGSHSAGRGVGYYADNLAKFLVENNDIELVHSEPDIIHYPFFDLFYPTLPLHKVKPTIVTIHDLTPIRLPHLYPKGVKGTINLYRQWLSLQSVKAVITDSQNSKKDLIKLFHLPAKKIFVTPLAADPIFSQSVPSGSLSLIRKKYKLPETFVLTVAGGPNPNKNLPLLAEATKELGLSLVIVGKGMLQELTEPVHPELRDLETIKQYDHIILPGFVPTEDLSAIYRLATLYCQPSLYEGFGLPVLEAMMAGCLVVSSNTSSLPEIYSDTTITFDPFSLKSLTNSLSHALSLKKNDREQIIKSQLHKSKTFTWPLTARLTADIYNEVLES